MMENEDGVVLSLDRILDHANSYGDCEVHSIVCFGKPFYRIVTWIDQTHARIWDSNTGEILKDISPPDRKGKDKFLIKWNSDSFLIAHRSNTTYVAKSFSLCSVENYEVTSITMKSHDQGTRSGWFTFGKQVAPNFLFICSNEYGKILEFDGTQFSHTIDLESVEKQCFQEMKVRKSINFPDCMYSSLNVNIESSHRRFYGVKMINWKTDSVHHVFKNLKLSSLNKIYGLDVFKNSRNEEIVVFGGMNRHLRVFRVVEKSEGKEMVDVSLIQDIEFKRKIDSLISLGNGFVALGDRGGGLFVVNLERRDIPNCVVHSNSTFFQNYVPELETFVSANRNVNLAAYNAYVETRQHVLLLSTGIKSLESRLEIQSLMDEKERIEFLLELQNSYIFDDEILKRKVILRIKLQDKELEILRLLK